MVIVATMSLVKYRHCPVSGRRYVKKMGHFKTFSKLVTKQICVSCSGGDHPKFVVIGEMSREKPRKSAPENVYHNLNIRISW